MIIREKCRFVDVLGMKALADGWRSRAGRLYVVRRDFSRPFVAAPPLQVTSHKTNNMKTVKACPLYHVG